MKIHDDEETKLKDKLDCDFCDKTFTRKDNLKSHILKMHQWYFGTDTKSNRIDTSL